MSDHDFQPGDVVELKSGGPQMTVASVRTTEDIEDARQMGVTYVQSGILCAWFAGIKVRRQYFDPKDLKKVQGC